MDRPLLLAAAACFAAGLIASIRGLLVRGKGAGKLNLVAILAGFACLTASLYVRGQLEGSCPLNSLYDVLIFQSWALVLIYLLVGPAYRLSLLGTFTAPLALALLLVALLAPISREPVTRPILNGWIEAHAALSMVAYGCFGLACIAGAMYLLQERQLKAHRFNALFYNLPPIADLATANRRLVALGLALLTVAFAAGLISQSPVHTLKFWGSLTIWVAYGLLLAVNHFRPLAQRRIAQVSVAVFAVALVTLPVIQQLSRTP